MSPIEQWFGLAMDVIECRESTFLPKKCSTLAKRFLLKLASILSVEN